MKVRYSRRATQDLAAIHRFLTDRSRVHLGVHWHFDCEAGSRAGARVADAVYRGAYRRY